jgi:hypothetical protein
VIPPATALTLVREQLRSQVLPRLDENDDYARSVLVAAIGVLGAIASTVREDDAWHAASTSHMRSELASWAVDPNIPDITESAVAELINQTTRAETPQNARRLLLAEIENLASDYWSGATHPEHDDLRRLYGSVLAYDVKLQREQLAHDRRNS